MLTYILALAMVLLTSGCAHKFTPGQVEAALTKGTTTKQEVLKKFGEPYRKRMSPSMKLVSGGKELVTHKPVEIWLYSPHQWKLLDMLEPEPLRIMFNTEGIVSNFDYQVDESDQ